MNRTERNPAQADGADADGWPQRAIRRLAQSFTADSGLLEGLHAADAAFLFAARYISTPGRYLWVCSDNRAVERIAGDLAFFLPPSLAETVLAIPGVEDDPYRGLSPHPGLQSRRALALWRLTRLKYVLAVTSLASLSARLLSPADFLSHCLLLETSGMVPRDHLLELLGDMGYVREDPVSEVGEYSLRGGIVDIYSPAADHPVRIEFFGDEIESIRSFDPATQRSIRLVPQCEIIPMRELPAGKRDVARWHESGPEHWNEVRFAQALSEKRQFTENGELFNGYEALFPLVIRNQASLLDYRPGAESPEESGSGPCSGGWTLVVDSEHDLEQSLRDRMDRLRSDFESRDEDGELVLPPERLLFGPDWWRRIRAGFPVFSLLPSPGEGEADQRFDFRFERKHQGRLPQLVSEIGDWREAGERVVFVMSTKGMAERMVDLLGEYDFEPRFTDGGFDRLNGEVAVTHGPLSAGFHSPLLGLHVLTQEHVFEERSLKREAAGRSPKKDVAGIFLSDFRDLKAGDFVVHIDHGIGQFQGLKRIGVGEDTREFVVLRYRGDSKLYVPSDRLDVLQKYGSSEQAKPQLDKLGGASWERTKSRIKKSMRDMADELLKLYAKRATVKGKAFCQDDELTREFEEAFEFEETPDQAAAIEAIKADMELERPMDRLVCGDVGYGKTEVAMRAAFKAVNDNAQVAVLTPTTVLAFQHFNTFRQRFQGFPVSIEMISRFRSRKEQTEILKRLAEGRIDILIGTHRVLSKDVQWQRLGLVIVDEEQRFGVAQKEKLKRLKTRVDVVTLSATPIPRTLNMSLIGLRDLSIIETPPKDRLAIQTVVVKFNRKIIRSGIDLELKRSGQVFFLHNSVETIHSIAQMVQETAPEARVAVAHGQMRESLLEEVMLDFLNYKYDVLVSTTIIENGLDIPRANTLIVNRADRFGLSQLYQLRGRVGRSSRRAYTYLLIPSEEVLSSDARRRLKAIREFSDLGAGFRIAALDLEIRGAGNLLGGEQHGDINAVGFELYTKLLEQTIRELRGEEVEDDFQTSIELHMDIQIPEHYIEDSGTRLWLYKRISSAASAEALKGLAEEITDRFGRFPRSLSTLLEYARLRLKAKALKILSIDRKGAHALLKFRHDTPLSPQRVIELVGLYEDLSLTPDGVISVRLGNARPSDVFRSLHGFLDEFAVLQ